MLQNNEVRSLHSLWIVEDDEGSCFVYDEVLSGDYELTFFNDLSSFENALIHADGLPDLAIVDLQLPDGSFLSFIQRQTQAKDEKKLPPYIVVSSLDDVEALRTCYEKGALDYITKPFGRSVLTVKIYRLLSLQGEELGGVRIDALQRTVRFSNSATSVMTSKEIQIMSLLSQAYDMTMSRNELVERIWGNLRVASKTLDVHLSNIRKKLTPLGADIRFVQPNAFKLVVPNDN